MYHAITGFVMPKEGYIYNEGEIIEQSKTRVVIGWKEEIDKVSQNLILVISKVNC